jgi:hypothetical protein
VCVRADAPLAPDPVRQQPRATQRRTRSCRRRRGRSQGVALRPALLHQQPVRSHRARRSRARSAVVPRKARLESQPQQRRLLYSGPARVQGGEVRRTRRPRLHRRRGSGRRRRPEHQDPRSRRQSDHRRDELRPRRVAQATAVGPSATKTRPARRDRRGAARGDQPARTRGSGRDDHAHRGRHRAQRVSRRGRGRSGRRRAIQAIEHAGPAAKPAGCKAGAGWTTSCVSRCLSKRRR